MVSCNGFAVSLAVGVPLCHHHCSFPRKSAAGRHLVAVVAVDAPRATPTCRQRRLHATQLTGAGCGGGRWPTIVASGVGDACVWTVARLAVAAVVLLKGKNKANIEIVNLHTYKFKYILF